MGQGVPSPLSSGTARLVWIEACFASRLDIRERYPASPRGLRSFHLRSRGAGTERQAFCNATSLDADVRHEPGARGTELCAAARLPKLSEPLANFSRARWRSRALGDIQLLQSLGMLAARWMGKQLLSAQGTAAELGFPKSHPKCKPGIVTLSLSQGRAGS